MVNWATMTKIAASWVISPLFGGCVAALLLFFIKKKVLNADDRLAGARTWVPILVLRQFIGHLPYIFLYVNLKKIMKIEAADVILYALIALAFIFIFLNLTVAKNKYIV